LRLDGTCEADTWIEILRRSGVEWLPFDNLVVDGRDGTIIGHSVPMRTRNDETMEWWTADGGRWKVDGGWWMADCGLRSADHGRRTMER
jgi:hypothetical protein